MPERIRRALLAFAQMVEAWTRRIDAEDDAAAERFAEFLSGCDCADCESYRTGVPADEIRYRRWKTEPAPTRRKDPP